MAISVSAGQQEVIKNISSSWNNYVNLETFQEDEVKQREIDMEEEYKYWSKVKPKIVKSADGKLSVSGII